MSQVIFKYPFPVSDVINLDIPKGAYILTVQVQNEIPCIWALVDPEAPTESRGFRCFGTGHPIDVEIHNTSYIGTFQLLGGSFVGHLFWMR